ncbi:hypothetical protein IGI37_002588 [Enterococcus sp. AZ194]|uniref:ABC transporter permease n=1 Tax=Enterococcus sp. AZ194 TaxID=2774629 RepID=UPI003F267F9D
MSNYFFFLKKELTEGIKTYKLPILACIFFIFGILSPMTAKFLPTLLPSLLGDDLNLELPEPSSLDSWTQYFKNMNQLGLIVVVLIFSGILSTELEKGTLVNLLTKGLSRTTVIFAKYSAMIFGWTLSLLVSFLVTWGYTAYYFSDAKSQHLFAGIFPLWLFGCLILSMLIFAATLVEKNYASLLIMVLFAGAGLVLSISKRIAKFNPFSLIQNNLAFIQGTDSLSDYLPALLICCLGILVLVFFSCKLMKQKIL